MNTKTSSSLPEATIRVTDLRNLEVRHRGRALETVECLAYDHTSNHVTGVHLRATGSDVRRQVAFESLDLSKVADGELGLEPPVLASRTDHPEQLLDTVTVLLPSGTVAYMHDGLINVQTGQIMAYEIGLSPHESGDLIRITPGEVNPALQGDP